MSASRVNNAERIAGRYRVERRLARGGMGTVYEVFDESTGKRVALKRLDHLPEDAGRQRDHTKARPETALFEREYYTLARLCHPRIIDVFDYGVDAKGPYYTMELLDGRDIRELAPVPYRIACRYLRDLASSLALLHAHRLVHRDISARNVRGTRDGRCKLLDFGSLTPFGIAKDVAGTPSYIPPESFHGLPLDQRTDLYSLGCLGYRLLTGREAFPARSLDDLPRVWTKRPALPSKFDASIPKAFEELVMSLMSHDPLARPSSASEVIDRLGTIAQLSRAEEQQTAIGYLVSSKTVGRDAELETLGSQFRRATRGHGSSALILAEAGGGKTRLLNEAILRARLSGAVVLHVDAALHPGSLGTMRALTFRMLDVAPEEAANAAQESGPYLQRLLSDIVPLRLQDVTRKSPPEAPGEAQAKLQAELKSWVLQITRHRPVVLAIDNIDEADEPSAGLLAALAREAEGRSLCVVVTASKDRQSSAVRGFRGSARIYGLGRLTRQSISDLVKSLFGEVPNTERVAEWLYDLSAGSPLACTVLVDHLTTERVVRYSDGMWVLPAEFSSEGLPKTFEAVQRAQIERLSPAARALAQALSVSRAPLAVDLVFSISGPAPTSDRGKSIATLDELVSQNVLVGSGDAYRFAQEPLRELLYRSLGKEQRKRWHQRVGRALLARASVDPFDTIEAGYHLMRGGEEERGADLLARAGQQLVDVADDLHSAVPALEAALAVYRRRGRPARELAPVIAPLATAGYFVDRKLAARYGEDALTLLRRVTGLSLAERLTPVLGARLGLYVGIFVARLTYLLTPRNRRPMAFIELMGAFLRSAATLAAVACSCFDPDGVRRVVGLISPLKTLGARHAATFTYRYCAALECIVDGRAARARAELAQLVTELRGGATIEGFSESGRRLFLGGVLYALGALESLRDGSDVLKCADSLEQLGPTLYALVADQLRLLYHAHRSETDLVQKYRLRVETFAIQRGSAWQVEIWEAPVMLIVQSREGDVVGLKRTMAQLERIAREIPSFQRYAELARGTYLRLRGQVRQAIDVFEGLLAAPEPRRFAGHSPAVASLSALYNELGDHERAYRLTSHLLATLTEEDRQFVRMHLFAQIQHGVAMAALGRVREAGEFLDSCIEEHEPDAGPVTLALLHEARARLALRSGDGGAYARHLSEMERWLRPTRNPALIGAYERLAAEGVPSSARRSPSSGSFSSFVDVSTGRR